MTSLGDSIADENQDQTLLDIIRRAASLAEVQNTQLLSTERYCNVLE
jgi:hypothetical protein